MIRRILFTIVASLILLAGGVLVFKKLASLRKPPERVSTERKPPAVRTLELREQDYQERLTGYGRARALRAAVVAAEVNGVIDWIAPELEVGARLAKGTPLVRIDARDLTHTVATREAELAQVTAALAQIRLDLTGVDERLGVARRELSTIEGELGRLGTLATEDVVSKNQRDQLTRQRHQVERMVMEHETQIVTGDARLDRAQADVDRAEAALAQARLDLSRVEVTAPYDARLEERMAEPGARVAVGTELFRVVDLSRVEVAVSLPASRYAEVEAGAAACIRPREGAPVTWSGAVERVSPQIDPDARTFLVYLVLGGTPFENDVPPGQFVVAEVDGMLHPNVIPVPRICFVEGHVYVVDDDPARAGGHLARAVTPEVRRMLPDHALVVGGLAAGERVVVSNIEQIGDGSRVEVVDLGDGSAAPADTVRGDTDAAKEGGP